MTKVVTVMGTRPEIIRLSLIVGALDRITDHVLVHTNQNYDPALKDVFFDELGVREPDYSLKSESHGFEAQISAVFPFIREILNKERPDRFLVLGDTNTGLSAIVAKRAQIPVYHLEAGNRCYDDRVPEEINRRIIDHSSDVLMPYTERSRQNLLAEGIPGHKIYVVGNPIYEVLTTFDEEIGSSPVLAELDLEPRGYFLVTLHRAENVDRHDRLGHFVTAFQKLAERYELPVIVSTHPRTRQRLSALATREAQAVSFIPPLSFLRFAALERSAKLVLTDSGTVQEECAILGVPNVTLRDVTERPETIEAATNILTGQSPERILGAVEKRLTDPSRGTPPQEYLNDHVSQAVTNIVLGHYHRQ